MGENINCSSINEDLMQKRSRSVFNTPFPRFELVSPYPFYSQYQLNMRRKTEILQYDNTRQNVKTKKQKYSYLASVGSNRAISQNRIFNLSSQETIACIENRTKPTMTTSCDVPGPPIILQYNSSIPLYNFGNFKQSRSYAIVNNPTNVLYSQYTKNVFEFFSKDLYFVEPDELSANHTFTAELGSLLTNDTEPNSTNHFKLTTPIAIWFNGTINSGYDINENKIIKTILQNDFINIHITEISFETYYNDTLVVLNPPPTITFEPTSLTDCSFNLNNVSDYFYGVQYVGMLNIENVFLKTPPNIIYSFKITTTYTYNIDMVEKLDFIKTGIYTNLLTRTDPEYLYNCTLSSVPPNNFKQTTFQQFNVI